MADTFGPTHAFAIQDTAAVINPIAEIGAARNGADNTGNLIFRTYSAGTATTNMTLDSSGNFGLGVTPSAWWTGASAWRAMNLGQGASLSSRASTEIMYLSSNWYFDGTEKYIATGNATQYVQNAGQHIWKTAASGTAGNTITFTQAMTLNASGNLGITETSPAAKLHISVASAAVDGTKGVRITNPAGTVAVFECGSSGDSFIGTTSGSDFNIRTGNTVRATFDNAGNLLVGTTTGASSTSALMQLKKGGVQWDTGPNGSNGGFNVLKDGTTGVYLTSGATAWSGLSDETMKDIIEPIENASQKISTLRTVIGKYKTDEEGTRRAFLIAQDVKEVLPEAVNENENGKLGLQYTDVMPLLVAAIKEQQALITQLTARITALESA
jgi:hypothetical protein